MQCFQGKSVYKGIAMGPVIVLKKNDAQVKRTKIEEVDTEIARAMQAIEHAKEQLQKLYDKAILEVGEASAGIFEIHQMMAGKKVIIRTLDIGADKQVDYFHLGKEDNPALGYRAIRICLKQPDIFKTQLRYIFVRVWLQKNTFFSSHKRGIILRYLYNKKSMC